MEILIKTARAIYGIMIAGLAFQELFYAEFRPVIFPPWPPAGPVLAVSTYIVSAALIVAGFAIVFDKKAKAASLLLGGLFLLIFCFGQIPYELMVDYYKHLGSWTSALKELALAGGAFVVAGSYPKNYPTTDTAFIKLLQKIVPFGTFFFCIVLLLFGIDHFLYPEFVAALVPKWIPPGQSFWLYFGAVALIGSGIAITLNIKRRLVGILLAVMLLLWLVLLHIPRAIADPYGLKGNEVASVIEAFGFSGVAYLMAVFKS
jgi:uncharacterized membrane protein YphA (DoxX/SURF4 family)